MLKRRTALVTIAVVLVGAASGSAHTTSFPSELSFDFAQCIGNDCNGGPFKGPVEHTYVAGGEVSSPKPTCVPSRKVKLFAVYAIPKRGAAPAPELLDIDRTSDSGAWSGRFTHDLVGVDHLQATLVKKNIGPQGHSHICETDSASWAFPSPT